MDYIDLGKRIRKQRVFLGWTQEQLAERVGVSTSFMAMWSAAPVRRAWKRWFPSPTRWS